MPQPALSVARSAARSAVGLEPQIDPLERRLDSFTRSPPALPPPLFLQSTCRRPPPSSYTPVPVVTCGAYYSQLGGLSSRSQSCPLVRPARHRALSGRRPARRARRPPSADSPSRSGAATRRAAPIAHSCLSRVGFSGRHAGSPQRIFPCRSAHMLQHIVLPLRQHNRIFLNKLRSGLESRAVGSRADNV